MGRGRLLEFRARVLAAHKRARGVRDDALQVAAKKVRLSSPPSSTAPPRQRSIFSLPSGPPT
eukprot:14385071-Alexandrium_andersonii.AAC.1